MHVVTNEQMRFLDEETIKRFVPGLTLMERAGQGITDAILELAGESEGLHVCMFLGRGNNAGDGLVVARLLAEQGVRCALFYLHEPEEFSPDAFKNYSKLEKLRKDPSLIDTGADEIIRWTSPVIHFVRTATEDYELRGQKIREGDSVALFYASANRDEEVFDDPFVFRIDRDPNPHLGFGIGEHFCLGSHLARMDLRVFFRQLLERVESIELSGPAELLHASFVGGPKRMPVRYRIRARS